MGAIETQLSAALLCSLRIAPTFAFAPPFTLMRIPASVRVILAFSLALWLVLANPAASYANPAFGENLFASALLELFLGVILALALQLAFGLLMVAGRTLDYQAGFGLSVIADPTLRTQMPLIGALLAYAAGALFFASNGALDLLAIWTYSLTVAPIGFYGTEGNLAPLLAYIGAAQLLAFAVVGGVMLGLFIIDIGIGFISRTLPQMNVLLLGFQIKTIALLMLTPLIFVFSGSVMLRLVRLALETSPWLM